MNCICVFLLRCRQVKLAVKCRSMASLANQQQEAIFTLAAPLFAPDSAMNEVRVDVESDVDQQHQRHRKPLLVRSLSMDTTGSDTHILALKSLSESCLSSSTESSSEAQQYDTLFMKAISSVTAPELIATNVDDDEEEEEIEEDEENICSCGCGVALPEGEGGKSPIDESEDEGCYFVSGTPPTRPEKAPEQPEKKKGEKQKPANLQEKGSHSHSSASAQSKQNDANANNVTPTSTEERRSFSLSVDSGRSSNTGTLGHSSTKSSTAFSSSSASSGEDEDNSPANSVKIVSHSYCDFLDKRQKAVKKADSQLEKKNKVSVFVPYSAISDLRRRESILAERRQKSDGKTTDVFGVADNVVICDTQVILRINTQSKRDEERDENHDEGEEEKEASNSTQASSKYSRRMARRMTTTVAVYEMVKAKSEFSKTEIEEEEDPQSKTDQVSSSSVVGVIEPPLPKKPPQQRRRKDLCKLLGLIECDVTTDATNPEDIQVARRVALENLVSAIEAQHGDSVKIVAEENDCELKTSTSPRKKNLAKFLGIDEVSSGDQQAALTTNVQSVSEEEKKPSANQNHFFRLMKNSMRWNHSKSTSSSQVVNDKNPDLEDLLDVYQLKKANEVVFGSLGKSNG